MTVRYHVSLKCSNEIDVDQQKKFMTGRGHMEIVVAILYVVEYASK